MYENPYLEYYRLQAGGNLAAYEGVRFQRGRGWFKKLGSKIMPALKYLGKNALSSATSFLGDIAAGRDVKSSLKRTALDTGGKIASDISNKAKTMAANVQDGNGVPRRKKRKSPRKSKPILYKAPITEKVTKKKRKKKLKQKLLKKKK